MQPSRFLRFGPAFLAAWLLLPLAGAAVPAARASAGRPDLPWAAQADSLLERGEAAAAQALLDRVLASDPDDPEAHWRAAWAAYQRGVMSAEPAAQNAWYRVGVDHARRALDAAPANVDVLRWAVAVTGSLADGKGIGPRETARLAEETWGLIGRLQAADPSDPIGHSAAGFLQAKIMKLNRVERLFAHLFLGSEPLRQASWEEALREQRLAVSLDPDDILYRVRLAICLGWHGDVDEARTVMDAALALPVGTPLEEAYRARGERWRAEQGSE